MASANTPPSPKPRNVPTEEIQPNPHNPRRLFDKLPLKTLEESIARVGILVPLTVYRESGTGKFTILDGQRRWICAQNLKMQAVPINEVPEPTVVENIVTMFQIHKLRLDWELMPTALKLGVLMKELDEKRDKPLAQLTGLDEAVVTRCKKLLTFPKKFQNMMLFADPTDRVKADFFIELYPIITDRVLVKAAWFERDHVTAVMLERYQQKKSGIKAITDFRKIKQAISVAKNAGKEAEIQRRFKRLLDDEDVTIDALEIDAARVHKTASTLRRSVSKLEDEISQLEVDEFVGEEELWESLEKLLKTVRKALRDADRRSAS